MVDGDRIAVGTQVVAHGFTFSATGVVIEESGRDNLKVLLDKPRAGLERDAPWFARHEVEPFSHASPRERVR